MFDGPGVTEEDIRSWVSTGLPSRYDGLHVKIVPVPEYGVLCSISQRVGFDICPGLLRQRYSTLKQRFWRWTLIPSHLGTTNVLK